MRQKITEKKMLGMLLAALLLFAAISCSGSGGGEGISNGASQAASREEGTGSENGVDVSQQPKGTNDKEAYTEEQMEELYGSIKAAVQEDYLEPNGIPPEGFQWPAYEVLSNGVIRDEGHAWSYFNNIALNYSLYGTLYDTKNFMYDLPKEPVRQLMDAVLKGMVNWFQDQGEGQAFQNVRDAIFPEYEKLPEHIGFL